MKRKQKKRVSIPDEVKHEVEAIVERFNRENSARDDCYYEAQFQGPYCHLHRADYGRLGPICRLTYTGRMDGWEFAIFKWSSERYAPNEWMFPGSQFVDGSIEGAMRAGLEAYPV
jgi:hypothetical protein